MRLLCCRVGLLASLLIILGISAAAQDNVDPKQDVSALGFLVGNWIGSIQHPDGSGGWQTKSETDFTFCRSLGNKYVEGMVQTGGYVYHLIFSFDSAQGRFRILSRDDQSGLLDIYEGDLAKADRLVVNNVGPGTFYKSGGQRIHNRMSFAKDGTGWVWLVEATADMGQKWAPQLRALVRPGAAPGNDTMSVTRDVC